MYYFYNIILYGDDAARADGILTKSQALYSKFNLPHHLATAALSVYHSHAYTHTRKTGTRWFRAVTPDKQTINLLGEKDEDARRIMYPYYIL